MTIPKVSREARIFAWPLRPSCYKDTPDTRIKWDSGVYDAAAPSIQSFAQFEQLIRSKVIDEAAGEGWQPIETAPKDGAEVLGYREDCGVLLMRWCALADFLTDAELAELDEETAFAADWFYADFLHGGRLEGEEAPTHWRPLPAPPSIRQLGERGRG